MAGYKKILGSISDGANWQNSSLKRFLEAKSGTSIPSGMYQFGKQPKQM